MPLAQDVDLGPLGTDPSKTVKIEFGKRPNKKKDMDEPCKAYKKMKERWELPLALREGTLEMRKSGREWLPQEPKEYNAAYENRLKRTVCYGAFNRTVSTLAGLPFMRPITIENLPEKLSYLKEDCDGMGRDLSSFSHSSLKEMIELGLTHILVDMPYFEGKLSLEDEQLYKIRPYFVALSPENLIKWTTERIGGLTILTSITIKEEFEEYVDYEEKQICQLRTIKANEIELWREDEETEEWYLYETLPNSLGKIPLVTIYGNYDSFMQATPPLEDLAWLNLKHYQQQSDLDNIQHVANVPILFGAGFDPGEMEGVEIGPNRLIIGPENSTLNYVEHTGAAIGSSVEALTKLEEQMAAMGADLIIRKSVDRQTATARAIDQSESVSMLQIMINNLETGIEQAIRLAGEWIDVKVSKELQIDIGDYLDTPEGAPNLIDIFAQMLIQNRGMSVEDIQKELKRRGVLSDVFKIGKREEISTLQQHPSTGQPSDNTQPDAAQPTAQGEPKQP